MTQPAHPTPFSLQSLSAHLFKRAGNTYDNGVTLGVLDSGVGGLSVLPTLLEATNLPPIAAVHYVADTAWMPYGNKAPDQLASRIATIIDAMASEHQVDAVVMACNTATTVSLLAHQDTPAAGEDWLATALAVPVVAMVFPAARAVAQYAADNQPSPILVMATDTLLATGLYTTALQYFAPHPLAVYGISGRGLAVHVENGDVDDDHPLLTTLAEEIDGYYRPNQPATVVLGCTHYPHVWPQLQAKLRYPVMVVDPAHYVPSALAATLLHGEKPHPANVLPTPTLNFWITGDNVDDFHTQAVKLMPTLAEWSADAQHWCHWELG